MNQDSKSNNVLAFSLGAVIGVAVAVLAALFQRSRQPLQAPEPEDFSTYLVTPPAITPSQSPSTRPVVLPPSGSPRWTKPTKYIMGVILFLVALVVLIIGRSVIPMVILAALLALFINPMVAKLNRRFRISWPAATAITYVLVILLLIIGILLLTPSLLNALNFLLTQDYLSLAGQAAETINSLSASLQRNPPIYAVTRPILATVARALENFSLQGPVQPASTEVTLYALGSELADRLGLLANIFGPIVSIVFSGIIILFMAFQMSLAANQMSGWYPDLIPPAYKLEYAALFDRITKTWISFLRGQITLMIFIGLVTWLGDTALGVPYALLMGLLAGLLELIPNVGPTLAAIPAVLLALFFGSTYLPIENVPFALLVVAFYVLVQFLENQFIVPYIMGDAVDLPPLIVLIGTLAGAFAFGILGALLATPVIATGNLLFQYIYRKILEPPPLPMPPEEKPSIWETVKGWARRIPVPGRKSVADKPVQVGKVSTKTTVQTSTTTEAIGDTPSDQL